MIPKEAISQFYLVMNAIVHVLHRYTVATYGDVVHGDYTCSCEEAEEYA